MLKRFSTIDRRLITILLIIFVQMVGAAMIVPILPLYARSEFGLSDQLNTMLITIFFLGQFVGGPYLGRLSDRIGRIPVLIVSQLGTALCFVLLAVAGTPWLLFVARLVDGITGGNIIVAQAYITDITPSERRTEALGYTFAVFGIGFIIGPAVGGLLAAELGPRVPYLIAAAAAFAVAIMTWLILEETVPRNGPAPQGVVQRPQEPQRRLALGDVFTNQMLFLVLIIALAGQFAFGMLQATFALYGNEVLFTGQPDDVVTSNVAYLLTVVGVGQFATQAFLLRPARNRLGETWLVIVGLLARTAGLAILAASRSFWPGALASLFFCDGQWADDAAAADAGDVGRGRPRPGCGAGTLPGQREPGDDYQHGDRWLHLCLAADGPLLVRGGAVAGGGAAVADAGARVAEWAGGAEAAGGGF